MRSTFLADALLVGLLTLSGAVAGAQEQQPQASRFQASFADVAATYTVERSNVTPGGGDFWLQGGSLNASVTFFRGFGFASNVTGDFSSHIAPGVGLTEIAFMGGPRYTRRLNPGAKHESRVFAEVLAGEVRGSNSAFPKPSGFDTRASSFTYQAGGGVDISISKHLAIRAIEADYVRTYLPNNASNTQAHLRLAFGVSYHTGTH